MSTQSTRKFPSTSEATCPDCGTTLSRASDMKRHRNTQHPDGTEVKVHCPHAGCKYKTDQKSNLKAHIGARHSNEDHHPCPDCNKRFADPSSLTRHRKSAHGHQPYHTDNFAARQTLKKAKKALKAKRKSGKKVSNETHDQRAAPHNTQNASSSAATLSNIPTNATHHNAFWQQIVNVPRRHASEPKDSQDVQISVPVAAAPACGAPKTLDTNSGLSLPEAGQLQFSTSLTRDETYSLGSQLDTIVQPQGQALPQLWTPYRQTIPVAASDYRPFAPTFPTSVGQSTYLGMSFQNLPTFSSMPNSFTYLTTPTAPSSSRVSGYQFVPPNHMATPPLEPVPALSWTHRLSPVNSTPLSQPEFFTSQPDRGFNSWCQSYDFSSEL
ncbi:hypothetical protein EDB92DRAFT_131894 [Lactarius akahatsu]|uniref:C2H2-type domain-containing protein n=1 Tax=Lactarius akahatsu TaxID=416441 RepID=A0AAD4Q920_9AGAM|nr:hypothetical protein EDB92DRAFT_131894 [Lactarius akahatsu]